MTDKVEVLLSTADRERLEIVRASTNPEGMSDADVLRFGIEKLALLFRGVADGKVEAIRAMIVLGLMTDPPTRQ